MKKALLLTAICLIPLSAQAFPPPIDSPEFAQHQQRHLQRISEKLKLSDEQTQRVADVFKQQAEKMQAIHQETDAQMQQILTPEQFTQLQDLKKERREKTKKRRHQHPADAQ